MQHSDVFTDSQFDSSVRMQRTGTGTDALISHTAIEAIKSLTFSQLWNSTKTRVSKGRNVTVEFRMFDAEARPAKAGCTVVVGC